jgi:prevent-host-death family protein
VARSVTIHEAKTQFSKLVRRAEGGEEILIRRGAEPAAKLVPIPKDKLGPRKLGGWEGKVWMASDFDGTDQEIERMFEESEIFPGGRERSGGK